MACVALFLYCRQHKSLDLVVLEKTRFGDNQSMTKIKGTQELEICVFLFLNLI